MKIKSAAFALSAPDLRSAPAWNLPEFALIGRSNVGKSSLINSLTARRSLAKVSDLPGKTQLINFFTINDAWSLVDLPGYGYAEVGKQRRYEFNVAVADFLTGRGNLRGILVLIDSRLPPQTIDLEFLRWLEGAATVHYALVFTKADKQSASKTQASVAEFLRATSAWRTQPPPSITTSSKTGAGRDAVLAHVEAALTRPGRTAE